MSMDKWATSVIAHNFQQVWVKRLLLLEDLNPLQGPTHNLTQSSVNTKNS